MLGNIQSAYKLESGISMESEKQFNLYFIWSDCLCFIANEYRGDSAIHLLWILPFSFFVALQSEREDVDRSNNERMRKMGSPS